MKIASKNYEQLTTSALIDLFESTRTLSHSLIPEKLAANVWNYLPKAEKENWIEDKEGLHFSAFTLDLKSVEVLKSKIK